MLDCLIFGDSIGVGTHQFKQQCVAYVKSGINSKDFNKKYLRNQKNDYGSEVAIISLGSNDYKGIKTYEELMYLRERVKSQRVYWILPNIEKFPSQVESVKKVAEQYSDFVITPTKYEPDKVHPTAAGYKEIAQQVE